MEVCFGPFDPPSAQGDGCCHTPPFNPPLSLSTHTYLSKRHVLSASSLVSCRLYAVLHNFATCSTSHSFSQPAARGSLTTLRAFSALLVAWCYFSPSSSVAGFHKITVVAIADHVALVAIAFYFRRRSNKWYESSSDDNPLSASALISRPSRGPFPVREWDAEYRGAQFEANRFQEMDHPTAEMAEGNL